MIEFERAIATYVPGVSRPSTSGTDSGVGALSWGSHALWLEGRTATAAEWSSRAIASADSLEGPYVKMLAQSYAAILDQIDGDVEAMLKHTTVAAELCSQYGFAYYREWPLILAAWADRGGVSDSPARIEQRPRRYAFNSRPRTAAVLPVAARRCLPGRGRPTPCARGTGIGPGGRRNERRAMVGAGAAPPPRDARRRSGRRSRRPSSRGSRLRTRRLVAGPPRSDQPGASRTVRTGHASRHPRRRPRAGAPRPPRSRSRACRHRRSRLDERQRERFAND